MKTLRYSFQAFQKDQFWLPLGLMALFMLLVWLVPEADQFNTARNFLGYVLPLIAGGLGAYAFLEDSALEIQFSTKRKTWRVVLERLGIILLVISAVSAIYQVFLLLYGIDLSPLGNIISRQLTWLVPSLALLTLGSFGSLQGRGSASGFALAGTIWLIQLLMRVWFIAQPVWKYVLLYMGVMQPASDKLWINQVCLLSLSVLMLAGSISFLQKQERYI